MKVVMALIFICLRRSRSKLWHRPPRPNIPILAAQISHRQLFHRQIIKDSFLFWPGNFEIFVHDQELYCINHLASPMVWRPACLRESGWRGSRSRGGSSSPPASPPGAPGAWGTRSWAPSWGAGAPRRMRTCLLGNHTLTCSGGAPCPSGERKPGERGIELGWIHWNCRIWIRIVTPVLI